MQSRGLATFDEMSTDCCYALQDKIRVTDPNGYRWEIFVVKIEDPAPELNVALDDSATPVAAESCCAPTCCPS
jgi:hypothetical protein